MWSLSSIPPPDSLYLVAVAVLYARSSLLLTSSRLDQRPLKAVSRMGREVSRLPQEDGRLESPRGRQVPTLLEDLPSRSLSTLSTISSGRIPNGRERAPASLSGRAAAE